MSPFRSHRSEITLIPLSEAKAFVNDRISRARPIAVDLEDALGLYTSVALTSEVDVPGFANTAVDGFAVVVADVAHATAEIPVELTVVGTIAAGDLPNLRLVPGSCARIMTGAAVPTGTEAVVMIEDTSVVEGSQGTKVRIHRGVEVGDNIRLAGSDIKEGSILFDAFTRVSPTVLASLASVGIRRVPTFRRLRVAVLSTGSELSDSPTLEYGKIRDTNRPALISTLTELGVVPVDYGCVPDDEALLAATFQKAAEECDAVITSGGVSVGDFDLSKLVLSRLSNGDMRWMQIAIKPAKPFAFGLIDNTPTFCLPGNPVSSLISLELLARPALRLMMGAPHPERTLIRAIADQDLSRTPDGRVHFVRTSARFGTDGRLHVRPLDGQSSHMLNALAGANSLVVLPDGHGVKFGQEINAMVLSADECY